MGDFILLEYLSYDYAKLYFHKWTEFALAFSAHSQTLIENS